MWKPAFFTPTYLTYPGANLQNFGNIGRNIIIIKLDTGTAQRNNACAIILKQRATAIARALHYSNLAGKLSRYHYAATEGAI